jgi:hypothetical protein
MNQVGGAEDVLENLVALFPDAPIHTSLYWPEKMPDHWRTWDIRTAFINRLPLAQKRQQLYFPLYPTPSSSSIFQVSTSSSATKAASVTVS